jgi:hypothetical protein
MLTKIGKIISFSASSVFSIFMLSIILGAHVADAACARKPRANWNTTWAFCNLNSTFQSKVRIAISTWDASDKYSYVEASSACTYAFSWSITSFNSRGWGIVPGTTVVVYNSSGNVIGATSFFNGDRTFFDSSCDGCSWTTGQFDRLTVALHEIGHWAKLDHPQDCGQGSNGAVMDPANVTKKYLRQDDLTGLSLLGVKK